MIDLKKINQIREGISLRDRPASQYGNLLGPKYGMDDKDDGNTPPTVPKTERDKKIKAALDQAGRTFPKPIANRPKYPKLKEAKDPREYDYEGDMAKSQLRSIISNAQEIHDMLEDNTNIAEWVQSKITLSADYITTVRDYMNSEVNEASDPKMAKPSLLTRVKKLNKQNKERSQAAFSNMFGGGNPASSLSIRKKSTNEEVEQLDEVKVGDKVSFDHPMTAIPGKTTKVTGTVHKIENDVVHIKSKDKYGVRPYQKQSSELTKIDEAVSKAKDLKTLLTRHSELAIAANKDGDHEAVKYHQTKMNDAKNKMAKLAKEEVDQLDENMFGGDKTNNQALLALLRHSELVMAAKKDGDHQAVKYHRTKMDNIRNQMAKPAKEKVEPIHEISKVLAKSYLDKTVDPVYGMPKHGMKDRMKGIRQASIRVLKKAGKPKTN